VARVLYFDCFSGASGDMILGALVDAGLPVDALRSTLATLGVGPVTVVADRVTRRGVSATQVRFVDGAGRDVGEEHHHRGLDDIRRLIEAAPLASRVRDTSIALFTRLAEAEAAVHDTTPDRVHFHEVGALDSILDIVGATFAIDWFRAHRVVVSSMNLGRGLVTCAHGTFPVPAPATARLVAGAPVYSSGPDGELLTPTGALLLTGHASAFGPIPPMRIERIGYGAGSRDPGDVPNVLRVFVGEDAEDRQEHQVTVIECEIDDMNPQVYGVVMDQLLEAGALDVYFTPVQMKKNRPGVLISVIGPPSRQDDLVATLFRETTTIGVRYHVVRRECLERERVTVDTRFGPVRMKLARRHGRVVNAMPEFDDCAEVARAHGVAVREVQADATRAYLEAGRAREDR